MAIINCPNCGKICNTQDALNCYMCNADLTAAAISKRRSPKPSFGTYAKLGLGLVVLIAGWFGVSTLLEWKSERARILAERKDADAVASFDYLKFENDENAIENALKHLPARFSFKPPTAELFQKELAATMAYKDTLAYKRERRDGGIQTVTKHLVSNDPITRERASEITQGGIPKGGNVYEYRERVFENVETRTVNSHKILDLKLIDFSYVKAPGDLLVCFVRYEVKTAVFQTNTETVQEYRPSDPAKPDQPKPIGNRIRDDVATENAKFEFKEGRWYLSTTGISDLEKLKQVNELKASAKAAPPK